MSGFPCKFLDVSHEWLSTFLSAPSAIQLDLFVHGGWQAFAASQEAADCSHEGPHGVSKERPSVGQGSAGGFRRVACLNHVLAQAGAFKTALDEGKNLTADYMDGMQTVMGKWYNICVESFVEAALACSGQRSVESLRTRIVLPGTGFRAPEFPEKPSWDDICQFYKAGQSYE